MAELISTRDAYGHDIDLWNEIKQIGWQQTPFLSSLKDSAPGARTNSGFGHQWKYLDVPDGAVNKHLEGAASAAVTKFAMGQALNHYQIFKNSFGVSGSEDAAVGVDNKKELARQGNMSRIAHMKSIEMALIGAQAPVQRVTTTGLEVAGELGGVKHFLTANTDHDMAVATVNQALTWDMILQLLEVNFMKGVPITHLMMNSKQKNAIDKILFSKTTGTNFGAGVISNNVRSLGDTAYGNDIKIILSPFAAQTEILGYNNEYVTPVIWRPTAIKDILKDQDGISKQYLTEMTLRVDHEFAIGRLKNLLAA